MFVRRKYVVNALMKLAPVVLSSVDVVGTGCYDACMLEVKVSVCSSNCTNSGIS